MHKVNVFRFFTSFRMTNCVKNCRKEFYLQSRSAVNQIIVEDGHGGHGFYDGHCTRKHAGVVTALCLHNRIVSFDVYRLLFHQESSYRLERYTEVDVLSVADTSLDTARVIGACVYASVVMVEHIVLLATTQGHVVEALAIGKAFYGVDAEHGMTQGCMELSESRLSQAYGASLDDTADDATDGIAFGLYLLDEGSHFFGLYGVGATHIVGLNQIEVVFLVVLFQLYVAYLLGVCGDADAQLFQGQLGQGTAHHARDGFASRRASATPMVAEAELLRIGIVGMRRAIEVTDVLVVVGMLVLVPHHKADGASGRFPFEDTREEFHLVRFLAAGGELRLSRTTTVQFLLHEVHVDGDAGRKAVYHATYTGSVRFAERGQSEYVAK